MERDALLTRLSRLNMGSLTETKWQNMLQKKKLEEENEKFVSFGCGGPRLGPGKREETTVPTDSLCPENYFLGESGGASVFLHFQ